MMKTLALYLSLSFFLLVDGKSKVEWTTTTDYDFGLLVKGEPASFDFEFKNISGEPFVIDNARPSCGCTVPEWQETPILPDSIGLIHVEFEANQVGYFRKRVLVFFSGQRKAEKLYIQGEVIANDE